MTLLTVWPDDTIDTVLHRTTDEAEIRRLLAPLGARFERWPVADLPAGAGPDELLAAYRERAGAGTVDVLALSPADGPERAAEARARLLAEHTYDHAQDRFVARGAGVFYLHAQRKVHALLCEPGDVLGVPARVTQWLDMGARPDFAVIRVRHGDGEADLTGSPISELFPDRDTLLAGHRGASVG